MCFVDRFEAGRGSMVASACCGLLGVVIGIAYLIMRDPWSQAKRYILIIATLGCGFSALLAAVGCALVYDDANWQASNGFTSW